MTITKAAEKRRTDLAAAVDTLLSYYGENPDADSFALRFVKASNGKHVGPAARLVRKTHADGALDPTAVAALTLLPGWDWDQGAVLFRETEAVIREWASVSGSALVPLRFDNSDLGVSAPFKILTAVTEADQIHFAGHMSTETAASYESIPGWSWGYDFCESLAKGYLIAFAGSDGPNPNFSYTGIRDAIDEAVENRSTMSAGEITKLENLPLWAWSSELVLLRFVRAAVEWHNAAVAGYDPESDFEVPQLNEYAEYWLEENGGTDGLADQIAMAEWTNGLAPIPAVKPQDMDLLTQMIEFVTENGHSNFNATDHLDLMRGARRWREDPNSVHPMVRETLGSLEGWFWSDAEANFMRALPYLEKYVAEHGAGLVPVDVEVDGFGLGRWLWYQHREQYDNVPKQHQPRLAELLARTYGRWAGHCDAYFAYYDDDVAALEWNQYFDLYGHAGIIFSDNAPSHLRQSAWTWFNRSRAWQTPANFSDEFSLPDFPDWNESHEKMMTMAFDRTTAMFIEREGEDGVMPMDHVEAGFPLGKVSAHALWALSSGIRSYGSEFPAAYATLAEQLHRRLGRPEIETWSYCLTRNPNFYLDAPEVGYLCRCTS